MSDVFISYKAEDRRRVEPLVQALQADGYSVWWDQHIGTGDDWRQTIERQLDAASCVIVIWSRRSAGPEGQFVRDEATRAQERHAYVPVTIDNVRIPLGFGESQATSLRGWRGSRSDASYQAILATVRRIAGEGGVPRTVVTKQGIDRRSVLAGGAVATAAVAGIGAWVFLRPQGADAPDSIAVLPFAELSGDPRQAYFAAGMAGEIRSTLMRVAGLKVAGSTSSAAVREDDAQTAAQKLGVANILTGNVRQTASTIRVTAELIDGRTGLAKWSQNYDRAPGDVIKIQTDIAENVARALAVALGASAMRVLGAGETANVAAQQLAFQARELSYQFTEPAFRRSLELIDKAITFDPDYARAYALKSFFASNLAKFATTPDDVAKGRREALQYARKALSIAPNLPIARSALAYAYQLSLRLREAMHEHRIAYSLASGDPDVIRNYGWTRSSILGETNEGLRLVDEALALDPLNSASYGARADVLFDARRYAEVVSYSLEVKRNSPDLFRFEDVLGHALLLLGRTKEAAVELGQSIGVAALLAARTGDRKVAYAKLAQMRSRGGDMASYHYARILAQLGDKDAAFEALDRAWEIRDAGLTGVKTDPYLDPLRSEPRYAVLLRRMNLPA